MNEKVVILIVLSAAILVTLIVVVFPTPTKHSHVPKTDEITTIMPEFTDMLNNKTEYYHYDCFVAAAGRPAYLDIDLTGLVHGGYNYTFAHPSMHYPFDNPTYKSIFDGEVIIYDATGRMRLKYNYINDISDMDFYIDSDGIIRYKPEKYFH